MPVQVSASAAKISRPKISGIYPRTRLYRVIDRHKEIPIIWVTSPPGAGKTSLVSHYLETNKLTTAWFQIDAGDSDLSTFYYYLGQSAKKATPRKRKDLPFLTPVYQEGVPAFTRNFFRELYARFSNPFAIVFDNYHEVTMTSLLHQMLAIGLQEIPQHGHVFIISRTEPPLEFSRFRANGQMLLLGWEKLQLSKDEMKGIMSIKGIAQGSIERIMQQTQGWMAGLILLMEQKNEKDWIVDSEKFNPKLLFDYFAGEVFQNTTQEIQEFLIKTALFPKMSLEMASKLSGIKQPGNIFDYLINKNYFTYRHSGNTKLYDYHPLFREFLLAKFNEHLSDVETTVIKWRAAELLQENNQIEPAVALLVEVKDWQKLAKIIISTAKTLIEQGRHHTVRDWILLMPDDDRNTNPWLLYWLGEAYAEYDPGRSWKAQEQAFYLFEQQQDVAGIYLSLSGIIYGIRNEHDGDVRRMDPWLIKLDQIRGQYTDFPSPEVEARVGTYVHTALWWRNPQHQEMDYWRERVLQIAPKTSWGMRAKFWVNITKAFDLLFRGEPARAYFIIETVRKETEGRDILPVARFWICMGAGLYLWRAGRYEESLENVDAGLRLSNKTGLDIENYQLTAIGASVALTIENMPLADHYMGLILPAEHGVKGSRYHFIHAWYEYTRWDIKAAKIHAQKSVQLAEATGAPFFTGLAYSCLAATHFADGEIEKAHAVLNKLLQLAQTDYKSKLLEYIFNYLSAYFYYKERQDNIGTDYLKQALTIGRDCNFIGATFITKKELTYILTRALHENIEIDYVHKVIRTMNLQPDPEALSLDNWPWPIEIFGFDHCELKKDGKPVQYSRKFPKKIMQLVGIMVANSGEHVAEEKIIEALWPDAEGDAGQKALTTTLHRLRKLFGNEAILLSEGRLSFNPDLVWSDVCTFENILYRASKLSDGASEPERKKLIENALSLYRGHFLGDSSAPWVIPARERLRNKYLMTLEEYGLLLENENKWQEAIKWYQKGLEMDVLVELFYQRLMYCYEQLDRRGDAVEVYRQCYRVMVASLGVEPSEKTKAIYNSVRAA